jgi:hypothetical protein
VISGNAVEAVIAQRKTLRYGDIFDNPPRLLKFCEFAMNMGEVWIQWFPESDPAYCGTDLAYKSLSTQKT